MTKFFILGKEMRILKLLLVIAFPLFMTHCASYDLSRRVVQQGNLMPAAKLDKLKKGMSKEDVAILMGTSLVSPLFNNQRWDYVFTIQKGNNPLRVQRVSLYFSGNVLSRIER
jgi:outer membrane protein assembly factor BamE